MLFGANCDCCYQQVGRIIQKQFLTIAIIFFVVLEIRQKHLWFEVGSHDEMLDSVVFLWSLALRR